MKIFSFLGYNGGQVCLSHHGEARGTRHTFCAHTPRAPCNAASFTCTAHKARAYASARFTCCSTLHNGFHITPAAMLHIRLNFAWLRRRSLPSLHSPHSGSPQLAAFRARRSQLHIFLLPCTAHCIWRACVTAMLAAQVARATAHTVHRPAICPLARRRLPPRSPCRVARERKLATGTATKLLIIAA